jgi:hypothetical protein
MKIIIYGHRGWIASYIIKYLDKINMEYYCSEFRVDDEKPQPRVKKNRALPSKATVAKATIKKSRAKKVS